MRPSLSPQEFVTKRRRVELKERSAAQEHFSDLCHLIGHPTPAEETARNAIGISKRKWSRVGHLANHEPLRHGKRRSQRREDELCDATAEEVSQAPAIVPQMIEGYLVHLQAQVETDS